MDIFTVALKFSVANSSYHDFKRKAEKGIEAIAQRTRLRRELVRMTSYA